MEEKIEDLRRVQARLRRGGSWRRGQAMRFHGDMRNLEAANFLDAMAVEDPIGVSDEEWGRLRPFIGAVTFNDRLDETTRDVAFRNDARTLSRFIGLLIDRLAISQAA